MKRILTLFSFLLVVLCMQAQVEHLKFMGIPIDGKIKDFQSELIKKGYSQISSLSSTRWYEGSFAGEKVWLTVEFDEKTNIVHSVGVVIPCYTKSIAQSKYENYVRLFADKYETDKYSFYLDYYDEHKDCLLEDIESGKLDIINMKRIEPQSDGEENICIYVSKMQIKDINTNFATFPLIFIHNIGNIGTITITQNSLDINLTSHPEFKNSIMIIYKDNQNLTKYINDIKKDF